MRLDLESQSLLNMSVLMDPIVYPFSMGDIIQHQSGTTSDNGTLLSPDVQKLIQQLLIKNSSQHRQNIIIVLAFGMAASLLVVFSIVRDAYKVNKIEAYSPTKKWYNYLGKLHPAEVFPFVVALAIVVQGSIFIGVQSGTLSMFWVSGCALTAQLIWPTIWLVPLVILVFSLEVTWRSLRKTRFQPRGRWVTPLCLAGIALNLLGFWLLAFLMPAVDTCPGSLIWWTVHYSRLGIIIGPSFIITHMISQAILISQLWRTEKMDRDERIAASRVVYTLVINIIIIVLVIPFWIERVMGKYPFQSSKLADIALTLSGLLHSALYVFLRANADRLAIRPKTALWGKKKQIRIFGPNDLNMNMLISTPLLAPPPHMQDWGDYRTGLEKGTIPRNSTDPRPVASPPPEPPGTASSTLPLLSFPKPPAISPQKSALQRRPTKTRYSIFPTAASAVRPIQSWFSSRSNSSEDVLQASQAHGSLQMPAPLFSDEPISASVEADIVTNNDTEIDGDSDSVGSKTRHSRNISTITSATVEIGMRLSSMPGSRGSGLRTSTPMGGEASSAPIRPPQGEAARIAIRPRLERIESERKKEREAELAMETGLEMDEVELQPQSWSQAMIIPRTEVASLPRSSLQRSPVSMIGIDSSRMAAASSIVVPATPTPTTLEKGKWPMRDSVALAQEQRQRQMMKSLPPIPAGESPAESSASDDTTRAAAGSFESISLSNGNLPVDTSQFPVPKAGDVNNDRGYSGFIRAPEPARTRPKKVIPPPLALSSNPPGRFGRNTPLSPRSAKAERRKTASPRGNLTAPLDMLMAGPAASPLSYRSFHSPGRSPVGTSGSEGKSPWPLKAVAPREGWF